MAVILEPLQAKVKRSDAQLHGNLGGMLAMPGGVEGLAFREQQRTCEATAIAEFGQLVRANRTLMTILRAVQSSAVADCYVGGGAIRSVVWDALQRKSTPTPFNDVDVVFFWPDDLSPELDATVLRQLRSLLPSVPWQVRNQAAVHLWYANVFGCAVAPLPSMLHAVGTWPETCTAIAIRLHPNDELETLAPFGVLDLMDMVHRWNSTRVPEKLFLDRIVSKRIKENWPDALVLPVADAVRFE